MLNPQWCTATELHLHQDSKGLCCSLPAFSMREPNPMQVGMGTKMISQHAQNWHLCARCGLIKLNKENNCYLKWQTSRPCSKRAAAKPVEGCSIADQLLLGKGLKVQDHGVRYNEIRGRMLHRSALFEALSCSADLTKCTTIICTASQVLPKQAYTVHQ